MRDIPDAIFKLSQTLHHKAAGNLFYVEKNFLYRKKECAR